LGIEWTAEDAARAKGNGGGDGEGGDESQEDFESAD
jgi:hypothetical protein